MKDSIIKPKRNELRKIARKNGMSVKELKDILNRMNLDIDSKDDDIVDDEEIISLKDR